jgi:hypothetical protein
MIQKNGTFSARALTRKAAREVASINRHAVQVNLQMNVALSFQANSADDE